MKSFRIRYDDQVFRPKRVFPSSVAGEFTVMFKTKKVSYVGPVLVSVVAQPNIEVVVPFITRAAGSPEIEMMWPSSVDTSGGHNLNIRLGNPPRGITKVVIEFDGVANVTVNRIREKSKQAIFMLKTPSVSTLTDLEVSVQVTIYATETIRLAGGIVWFRAPKIPVIQQITPNKGLKTGGEEVAVSVRDLGSGTGATLLVSFGTQLAPIRRILASTDSYVSAIVETPDLSSQLGSDVALQIRWSNAPQNVATANFVLFDATEPLVVSVSPEVRGFVYSGTQPLSILTVNLQTASIRPSQSSDVFCSFGTQAATVISLFKQTIDGAEHLALNVMVPPATTAGIVSVVVGLTDNPSVSASFDFTFIALPTVQPSIVLASEVHGPLRGGNLIELHLRDLVQVNYLQEVAVLFDGKSCEVLKVSSSIERTQVTIFVPTGSEPGEVSVSVHAVVTPQAIASMPYTYDAMKPAILSVSPSTGPFYGEFPITIKAANLPPTSSIQDVRVSFASQDFPTVPVPVTRVRLKQTDITLLVIQVRAPPHAAGNVTATVTSRNPQTGVWSSQGGTFTFWYTELEGQPKLDYVDVSNGANASIQVSNFNPPSQKTDVNVTFGTVLASVLDMQTVQATTILQVSIPTGASQVPLVVQSTSSYASVNFTYTSTSIKVQSVSPQRAYAGRNVSLVALNLPQQPVSMKIGSVMLNRDRVYRDSDQHVLFTMPLLSSLTADTVLVCSIAAGTQNSTFSIRYRAWLSPSMVLSSVEPTSVPVCGGLVHLYLSNLLPQQIQTSSNDVKIFWSNSRRADNIEHLEIRGSQALIQAYTPVWEEASTVLAILAFGSWNNTFEFEFYEASMPYVVQHFPAHATQGDDFFGIIKNLPMVRSPEEISIQFVVGTMTVNAIPRTVSTSTVQGEHLTEISLQTPRMNLGQVAVSIKTASCPNQQLQLMFNYVDRTQPFVVSQSQTKGTSDGGTQCVLVVANMKEATVASLSVNFGPVAGVVLSVFPAEGSEQISVLVTSPKLKMASSESILVQQCELTDAATGMSASFPWTFVRDGKADIVSVAPVRGTTKGGTAVELIISSFSVVSNSAEVRISFGDTVIASSNVVVVYSNEVSTKLILQTAPSSAEQTIGVLVSSVMDKMKEVSFDFIYILSDQPSLTVSPASGTTGTTVTCTLSHSQTPHGASITDLDVQFLNMTVSPKVIFSDSKLSIFTIVAPEICCGSIWAPITIDSSSLPGRVAAAFEVTSTVGTALSVPFSTFPTVPVSISGGTAISINLFNFTTAITVTDINLMLGGVQTETQSASCVNTTCRIDAIFPSGCARIGSAVEGKISLVSDPSKSLAIRISTFAPCEHGRYCIDRQQIADQALLKVSPPTSSICDSSYCIEPPNTPRVDYWFPREIVAGCPTEITLNLVDFLPANTASDISVLFDGTIKSLIKLEAVAKGGVSNITVTAPTSLQVHTSQVITVVVSIGESSATFPLIVSAAANRGGLRIVRISPVVVDLAGGEIFIEAAGFPVVSASSVRILFGGVFTQPTTFTTSGDLMQLTVTAPSVSSAENMTLSVQASVIDCQNYDSVHKNHVMRLH